MSRFLVEYELKSIGTFDGAEKLEFSHPEKAATITLREKRVDLNDEYAVLSAYVVLDASSLEGAADESEGLLSEFVHAMKLATSLDLRIDKKLKVIEWEHGLAERKFLFLEKFVGDNRPYRLLSQNLVETAEVLTSDQIPPALRRAIRWFSLAISANYMDEQFQCFWFVLEILAQHVKTADKVPDACAKCRHPLYCEKCKEHTTHRPYPKQAIQFVFSKVISDKPNEAFDLCNDVRNRLMHGDSLEEIEGTKGIEFQKIVDNLGHAAWRALRTVLSVEIAKAGNTARLELLQTNTFCPMVGIAHVKGVYTSPDPANPRFGEWPEPIIEIQRS